MKRAAVSGLVLLSVVWAFAAGAREFEVRLLEGDEQNGIWGTAEFQVRVQATGIMRHLRVKGQELVWQAVALYTSPVPPGEKKGVRTVQGEGHGTRGLSVEPPVVSTRDERGKRVFEFEHLVSNKKVLEGRPLCHVLQKLIITPTGEIHVSYDCEWLHTLRWSSFQMYIVLDKERCGGREYMAIHDGQVKAGALEPGPAAERRIRFAKFEQLTIRPEVGPFHFVWDAEGNCSLHWPGSINLSVKPPCVPYRGFVYKGQKDRIAYRILLPVAQE